MTPSEGARPGYALGSVDNALRLIWLLYERGELRVSEAAELLDTSRSTAYRLLSMLEYHRFAEQDPGTKVYAAGTGLLELGLAAGANWRRSSRTSARVGCPNFGQSEADVAAVAVARRTAGQPQGRQSPYQATIEVTHLACTPSATRGNRRIP
jgi:IclR helix-turn-helix domain